MVLRGQNRYLGAFIITLLMTMYTGCSTEDDAPVNSPDSKDPEPIEAPSDIEYPFAGETGTIEWFDPTLASKGVALINDADSDRVYLLEKGTGAILHEWQLDYSLGNDAELLEDGRLLVSLAAPDPEFSFGGFGGIVQIINPDGSLDWSYTIATTGSLGHHDVEMLPSGNILILVWDKRSKEEAVSKGYNGEEAFIYTERIIEVDPQTNTVIWQWDSWDHLIQDHDPLKSHFGNVAQHPQRIDLNYIDPLRKEITTNGDIMHANGLAYDPAKDLVYLSVNFYSEVWVIDHSTTLDESGGSVGGTYGKGGDLIYRFGNPDSYDNPFGERLFYSNHHPNVIPGSNAGQSHMLIFVNGNVGVHDSVVYELVLPEFYSLEANQNNEPEVVWSFTDPGIFSPKVSGAVRLKNGNTLITSGINGLWEVTSSGELAWRFSGNGFYWRTYHYQDEDQALVALGI